MPVAPLNSGSSTRKHNASTMRCRNVCTPSRPLDPSVEEVEAWRQVAREVIVNLQRISRIDDGAGEFKATGATAYFDA